MSTIVKITFLIAGILTPAQASTRYYLDVGGGYGTAMGFHTTLAAEWQRSTSSALCWSLGVQPRFEVTPTANYIPAYLVGRFQVSRFYLGAGFAPIVKGAAAEGTMGALGEFGIDFKIIPTFSVVIGTTAQTLIGGSSTLIAQGFMAFRFYTSGGATRAGRYGFYDDYDGWRYPYGQDRN